MPTIVKWIPRCLLAVALIAILVLTACTPAGPRALLEGEAALRSGQLDLALSKLRVATEMIPYEPRAWNYLGLACQQAGQTDAAIRAYQQAISRDRLFHAARFNLGSVYSEQGNWPAAIQELSVFVQAQPRSPQGWLQLGLAQLRNRQYPLAEASLGQALQLDAALAEAWNGLGLIRCQRGNYRDATNYFATASRYDARLSPALLNHAVVLHQQFKNRPLALQKYREYLEIAPAIEIRAQVQLLAAQLDQELNPVPRSTAIQTNAPPLLATRVTQTVHVAASPPLAATNPPSLPSTKPSPKVDAAIEKKPARETPARAAAPSTPVAPRTNISILASSPSTAVQSPKSSPPKAETKETTRPADPKQTLETASIPPVIIPEPKAVARPATAVTNAARIPPVPDRPSQSGVASALFARTDLPRYPFQRLLLLPSGDRDQAENYHRQGAQEQQAGHISTAIDLYRKAIQTDPSFYDAYRDLGTQASQAGDLPLTLFAYERALIAHPAAVSTRFSFAMALERANYVVDAAQELERVIAASPGDHRPHLVLANLYAQKLQQPLLAREHYQRVLEMQPQHPQAASIRQWLAMNP